MTDHAQLADTIIRSIRADGFRVTVINYLAVDGNAVKFTAWRAELGEVRPGDAELWTGKGPTRYVAAVALADALGWELASEKYVPCRSCHYRVRDTYLTFCI